MSTRVRNQRGEGERLRTALLDAAAEMLVETHDVDQLSVRAVTGRAGVSPTALYLHFADKDELIDAVKQRCVAALADVLRQAEAEHDGDPLAQARAMGLGYLRFAREQPGQYAILFQIPKTHTDGDQQEAAEAFDGVGAECFGLLVNAVTRCIGDREDIDPFETSVMLWLSLHGRATLLPAMPGFPLPDEKRYVDLLSKGFLA
jgi:AcrR family transcriptional regulator